MEAEVPVLIGRSIRAKSLLGIFLFTTLKSRNAKLDLDSHIDPHRVKELDPDPQNIIAIPQPCRQKDHFTSHINFSNFCHVSL